MAGVDPKEVETARKVLNSVRSLWLSYANVTGMDVGFRQVGGELTEEIAIRIYVSRKRLPQELAPGECFPTSEQGVRVDVIEFQPRPDLGA